MNNSSRLESRKIINKENPKQEKTGNERFRKPNKNLRGKNHQQNARQNFFALVKENVKFKTSRNKKKYMK